MVHVHRQRLIQVRLIRCESSKIPRYYCDYCDTYLTHDPQAGRKQHNEAGSEDVKLSYIAGQGGNMNPGDWLRATARELRKTNRPQYNKS